MVMLKARSCRGAEMVWLPRRTGADVLLEAMFAKEGRMLYLICSVRLSWCSLMRAAWSAAAFCVASASRSLRSALVTVTGASCRPGSFGEVSCKVDITDSKIALVSCFLAVAIAEPWISVSACSNLSWALKVSQFAEGASAYLAVFPPELEVSVELREEGGLLDIVVERFFQVRADQVRRRN